MGPLKSRKDGLKEPSWWRLSRGGRDFTVVGAF